MIDLLPNEHWDYRSSDLIRGLGTVVARRGNVPPIHLPGLGPELPVCSGRAGILLALKALDLAPHARIAVPLYCCPVVFKAIEAAGCSPQFIDVEPTTYCMSTRDLEAKRAQIHAVIAVHMFGNVCDMPQLQEAAQGKPFIEDCAQALGSRLNGRLAGSFAEVAAFSFRLGKYLSVGEGGALYSGQANLTARLRELAAELPSASGLGEFAHVARTYARSLLRTRPLWGLMGVQIWKLYNEKVNYASQSPLVLGHIYEADRATAIRRLPQLDSWIDRQRSTSDFYSRNLAVDAGMLCSEKPGQFFNRLQYPILTQTAEQCEQLVASLRKNQISTARPYKDIAAIAAAHYGYTGDCPQAERIAQTVLVIPCNHSLRAGDVQRVTNCVNDAWAQIRGRRRGSSVPAMAPDAGSNVTATARTTAPDTVVPFPQW